MKALLITSFIAISLLCTCLFAQLNYNSAISAAKDSEGSDSAIEEAMQPYGFNQDVFEEITMKDKIVALFNVATN